MDNLPLYSPQQYPFCFRNLTLSLVLAKAEFDDTDVTRFGRSHSGNPMYCQSPVSRSVHPIFTYAPLDARHRSSTTPVHSFSKPDSAAKRDPVGLVVFHTIQPMLGFASPNFGVQLILCLSGAAFWLTEGDLESSKLDTAVASLFRSFRFLSCRAQFCFLADVTMFTMNSTGHKPPCQNKYICMIRLIHPGLAKGRTHSSPNTAVRPCCQYRQEWQA